jgi:glutamine amidotransferase
MSRLLGYMCSDDSLTPYAMEEVRQQAWLDEANQPASLGFGWVQESRTLLRKHPSQSSEPVDVLGLLADIPARAIVGHMRENLDGAVDSLDLQPFRFRKWVYSQSGQVPRMEEFREELVARTPDHIRRNIAGKTGAEVVFHRFYHWLKKTGALTPSRAQGRRAAQALAATVDELEAQAHAAGFEGPLSLDIVAATERLVVAARLGDPIHYRVFDGMEQPGEEPLFAGHRPKRIKHPHFKGVFLGSKLRPEADGWRELSERSVMWVDGSWEAKAATLEELLER